MLLTIVHILTYSHMPPDCNQDNQSKFGTSVAMKGAWQLKSENPVTIQAGRTVIYLSLAVICDVHSSRSSVVL
eukprot:2278531-Amphidinium_carterae.1